MSTDQPRQLVYCGKTQTVADWAKEKDMPVKVLRNRVARYDQGLITLDEVIERPYKPMATKAQRKRAHRAIDKLMEEFYQQGVPRLAEEMAHYLETGDMGNAMRFFKTHEAYFCLGSYDKALQKDSPQLAQMIQIVVGDSASSHSS